MLKSVPDNATAADICPVDHRLDIAGVANHRQHHCLMTGETRTFQLYTVILGFHPDSTFNSDTILRGLGIGGKQSHQDGRLAHARMERVAVFIHPEAMRRHRFGRRIARPSPIGVTVKPVSSKLTMMDGPLADPRGAGRPTFSNFCTKLVTVHAPHAPAVMRQSSRCR